MALLMALLFAVSMAMTVEPGGVAPTTPSGVRLARAYLGRPGAGEVNPVRARGYPQATARRGNAARAGR